MSSWPDPAEALALLKDAEYQAACRRHRKYAVQETSEELDRAKERSAGLDALRWKKQRRD